MNKKKIKLVGKLIGLILLITAITRWILPFINSSDFQHFVVTIGPFGPFVIIFVTLLSHIFLPFAGSPVLLLSFTIYGIVQTSLYMYIASMISGVINYEIARQYGRRLVKKLVSKDSLDQIEVFSKVSGEKTLILARLFAFPFFEIVSYASGLTKIPFKNYLVITVLVSAVPNLTLAYLFRGYDLNHSFNFVIWIAGLILLSFGFSIALRYYHDKYLQNKSKV